MSVPTMPYTSHASIGFFCHFIGCGTVYFALFDPLSYGTTNVSINAIQNDIKPIHNDHHSAVFPIATILGYRGSSLTSSVGSLTR